MARQQAGGARSLLSAWRYYRRCYTGPYGPLLAGIGASVAQGFLLLPITFLAKYAFDVAIPRRELGMLVGIGAACLLLYVLNAGIALWVRHTVLSVTKRAIRDLRDDLFSRLYTLPRAYYSAADLNDVHTRIAQDTERIDVMTNAAVAQLAPALVTVLALGAALIWLNWVLFLVLLVFAPVLLLVNRRLGTRVRGKVQLFHRAFERFSKGVAEALRRLDLTHIQSAQVVEITRQRARHDELRRISGRMAWLQAAYTQTQSTVVAAAGLTILVVGGILVALGALTIGALLSFYVAVDLMKDAVNMILFTVPQIIAGNESLRTLYTHVTLEATQPYDGTTTISYSGAVTLDGVAFQYGTEPLLEGVRLDIPAGTTVGILGPNGAGKSTLIALILGQYRPREGQVLADGHPYAELDLVALRRAMGVVTQDPILFPGTIAENIRYGSEHATDDEVIAAARRATADEFIRRLPQGYETPAGGDGVLLSGGQRQRIAIARALVRRPTLLVLDEPTNHLDQSTITTLLRNIRELPQRPSIIIISHNMDAVRECDALYRLCDGRLMPWNEGAAQTEPGLEVARAVSLASVRRSPTAEESA